MVYELHTYIADAMCGRAVAFRWLSDVSRATLVARAIPDLHEALRTSSLRMYVTAHDSPLSQHRLSAPETII